MVLGNVTSLMILLATKADIVECVNGEIMDPFIWILTPLGIVFLICAWLERRKN